MRGKVSVKLDTLATAGITPAYAGKSLERVPHTPSCQDHPRLCGEKCRHRWRKGSSTGSPPPMRGKAAADTYHPHYHGITPAYAGKSLNSTLILFMIKDHPRLCGEKTKKIPKQRYFFHQPASFSFSLQYT